MIMTLVLKYFSVAEMLSATRDWVSPGHRKHLLLSAIPEVAPQLVRLSQLLGLLLKTQPTVDYNQGSRSQALSALDQQHDNLVRGLSHFTLAMKYLATTAEESAAWDTANRMLLPEGLAVIVRSYADEAGQAELTMARLTPEMKARFKATALTTPAGKTTLLAEIERYQAVATELGQAALAHLQDVGGPTRQELLDLRNQWIRVVNALLSNLEMIGPSPEVEREILAPLEELARRTRNRRTAPEEPGTPAPAPAAPTPTTPGSPTKP
jgi:hypothetical protein